MRKAVILILGSICTHAKAQIPVEVFGGHERATVDIMFFKYFKDRQDERTRWLFFNRNRAVIDYKMTGTEYLPRFGFTEAISYNHEKLRGVAPVLVGQLSNSGVYPKAGIQYARINKKMTLFTWLVCEILEEPDLDYFLLFRYTPKLSEKINLFTQVESVNVFPSAGGGIYNFTQRFRLGIQLKNCQFGAGADFNQVGNNIFTKTCNAGAFIRYEF